MNFDVYCDEAKPDALSTTSTIPSFLVIGSLWMQRGERDRLKTAIHNLRDKYFIGGEFKWQKVSPSKIEFYNDIIALFFSEGNLLRYRCIVVDQSKVNPSLHQNDHELGFYKFYYQLLHQWINEENEYSFFCDYKLNRDMTRLNVLKRCLENANMFACVKRVQAIESKESVLIQLTDLLTGATSAKVNNSIKSSSAKKQIIDIIESKLGHPIIATHRGEQKYNVFKIGLEGGW